MEELLASLSDKTLNLSRGQEISGKVISKTDKEIILDLGTKSEGVLSKKDFPNEEFDKAKIGDSLNTFVAQTESDAGQIILSLNKPTRITSEGGRSSRGGRSIQWDKFTAAKDRKTKLSGQVVEINKGGLIVEVNGVRGFLPSSLIGEELIAKIVDSGEVVGQEVSLVATEVDQSNNKLIFSQKGLVDEEAVLALKEFKVGQKVVGKVVFLLPFGALVEANKTNTGIIFAQEAAWEKEIDLNKVFQVGQEVEASVVSVDNDLGRVSLSTKQLADDPFVKLVESLKSDDVVKGVVREMSQAGVAVRLENGVEGLLPSSKIEAGVRYEVGQEITVMIDNIDKVRRRVNLAPFITSTAGLIYK